MSKKKKHIQTEKERLFQEEAARKRTKRAEEKRRKRIKDAWWLIGVACILFAVALGFSVWTAARMHNFETNYITISGTVSDYKVHRGTASSKRSSTHYTLVISYYYGGQSYKLSDTASYNKRPTDMIGTTTEIYVNPQNPEQAKKVTTADDPSFVSAIIFPFGTVFYTIGALLLLQEKGNSFVKRLLIIWLPLFLWCAATVLLYWIGLPNDGFGSVFTRVEGAIGYTVVAGIALLAFLTDTIITNKKPTKKN